MRAANLRVLGEVPHDDDADIIIRAGRRRSENGRVVTVAAPRWTPDGHRVALPEAYRQAMAVANERGARTMTIPGALVRGSWPLDDVTRIAMTVLLSTPTSVLAVSIIADGPGLWEAWTEALARES